MPAAERQAAISWIGQQQDPVKAATGMTKIDEIKILHARNDPGLYRAWAGALGPMDRQELDASQSKEGDESFN